MIDALSATNARATANFDTNESHHTRIHRALGMRVRVYKETEKENSLPDDPG